MSEIVKPSSDFEYYKQGAIYWNDFEPVIEFMNYSVSNSISINWVKHVLNHYGKRNLGLFVSCGNGWVERDCFQSGLISKAVGFDVMEPLIEIATREAKAIGLPARYFYADGNDLSLEESDFDIVVNNGSMHHIAKLDQMLRKIHGKLVPGGLYVMNDYTGPHRNQYGWPAWSEMLKINASLPQPYRVDLQYPHMPTMLHMDPTEAIHSELQMEVTRRYFDLQQEVMFGGALSYTLLYGNQGLYRDRHSPEGRKALDTILSADAEFTRQYPESNLFTFAIGLPKRILASNETLHQWTAEENEREVAAAERGKRYYDPTPLEILYNEVSDLKYKLRLVREVVL